MSKVTFDYSKASAFISNEEVSYMEKLVADAKEQLVSKPWFPHNFYFYFLTIRQVLQRKTGCQTVYDKMIQHV